MWPNVFENAERGHRGFHGTRYVMESENVFNYIQEIGYRTLDEIKAKFSLEQEEILTAVLDFLISRNKIRKIKFRAPSRETKVLFYVVSNE
jgi:hypothetical protein